MPALPASGPVLVFDGDCGFCTTSVQWFEAHFDHAFAVSPYQRTDLPALGLTEAECHERLQWIGDVAAPRETRREGARAVSAMVRYGGRSIGGALGTAWRVVGTVADIMPVALLADVVYVAVAANRQRLPGGTPACAL